MKISKKKLRKKIGDFELLKKDGNALISTIGFIKFLKMDFQILFNCDDLRKKYGKQPLPFSENNFKKLYNLIRDDKALDNVIEGFRREANKCMICSKEITEEFETGGNMFSHTSYGWHVRDKHPINWGGENEGAYHWGCFITTEEGKKFEQELIDGREVELTKPWVTGRGF